MSYVLISNQWTMKNQSSIPTSFILNSTNSWFSAVQSKSQSNRINKKGSQKDAEQKKSGNYFFYDDGNDDDDDDFDDI